MTSLIVMGLSRMFRSMVFKIGMCVMVLYPLFIVLVSLKDRTPDSAPLNGVYNSGLVFIGLLIGAFVSVLIGQDYIEKTINNKIMAGHSRAAIYLSDFIVTFIGAVIMQMCCAVSASAAAIPLFGMYTTPLSEILRTQPIVLCVIAVYTALALFVTTIVNSKSYAVAASMFLTMAVFAAGMMSYQVITEDKAEKALAAEQGKIIEMTEEDTLAMKIFGVIYDADPQSQVCVLSEDRYPENGTKYSGDSSHNIGRSAQFLPQGHKVRKVR